VNPGQKSQAYPKANLGALTGLRFIAAMAVYLFHFGAGFLERLSAPAPLVQLLKNGFIGVSIFFVLSGFILAYTYADKAWSPTKTYNYILARLARVYPVYIFALLLALPVLTKELTLNRALLVLSMTQSWTSPYTDLGFSWITQAWTLSVELFFYLCFPIIVVTVWRSSIYVVGILMIGVTTSMVVFALPTIGPSSVYIPFVPRDWTPIIPVLRLCEFIYGITLCRIFMSYRDNIGSFARGQCVVLLITVIVIVMSLFSSKHAVALSSVLFGLLILQLALDAGAGPISRFLSHPAMVLLGGASYSLYLLQGPIHELTQLLHFGKATPLLQYAITLGLSIILFKYYEEPIRQKIRSTFGFKFPV